MSLSYEEVAHVANLARLHLEPDELEKMRVQLSNILDHITMLQELDIEGVPATATVTYMSNMFSADTVYASLPRAEALQNAPAQAEGMFRVGPIFEEE